MLEEIYKKIESYDTIVIARHIGVDPDALGAQLGLKHSIMLTFPNKKVFAIGSSSSKFRYFPKLDKLEQGLSNVLFIVVDTPDKKRVDASNFDSYSYSIKMDHHPYIESFCDLEYIDDKASSASEIILRFIKNSPLKMNKEIAEMLFMGIVSDTNRFLYNSPNSVFSLVSELLTEYELDTSKLYQNIYMRPLSEVRLQGYIAQNMIITNNGLAYIKITNDIMNQFGVDSGSAGNLINNFNNIEEVYVWVTISEDVKNNLVKLNIRSRGPIVNQIAEKYHGGGHKFASGARVASMNDADRLINDLDEACRIYLDGKDDGDEN